MRRIKPISQVASACIALVLSTGAIGQDEAAIEDVHLGVYPPSVAITTAADAERIIVVATGADGVTRNVTAIATVTIADPALARWDGVRLFPLADGGTTVNISVGGQSRELPLAVTRATEGRPISFRLDVVPVFTRAGCNSGACHGSARGQDGFRLSLFGFDPEGDWHRLTHEFVGRRINLAFPHTSLMLDKPAGRVPHTGGKRFEVDSAMYDTLRRWVASGVPNDAPDIARVDRIELYPPEAVLGEGAEGGASLPLVVIATYSDGTTRDVTDLVVFRTNNEVTALVNDDGALESRAPGEAFITASFDTHAVGMPVIVRGDTDVIEYYDPADGGPMVANYIDELVAVKLSKLRINPSPLCTDETFVRRVYLDVIGRVPTPEQREAFLVDEAPDKRSTLVQSLLARREFADQWVMQWAELLQIRSNLQISEKAALLYFEWVRNAIAAGVPIDEMVRNILTATGGTFTSPATNFYQNQTDTLVLAESVSQAFMGIRVQCAQCHNHPFDRWTQDDYYGLAAFFPQVGRKKAEDPRETIVFDRRNGEVKHPVDGRVMTPKFLGDAVPEVKGKDRRAVFAEWLTAPENPYFARSFANRVWAHFMGVGIVEPVDDFRVSNPASNAPLLDALARSLAESGYDFKKLVYDICVSRAYQRATSTNDTNATDDRNFSHALLRRLRAETLLDVVCQVTESPEKFRGLPLGAQAVHIADGTTSNYFLTTFGRAKRDTVAACEVNREPSLSQALHLLNGETINRKINEGGVISGLLATGQTPEQIMQALYMRCLGRAATEDELATLMAEVDAEADPTQMFQDIFWALLNAREFIFNH